MYADCEVYIIIYLYTAKGVLKMTCLSNFSSHLCNINAHHWLVFFPSSSLYLFSMFPLQVHVDYKKMNFLLELQLKVLKVHIAHVYHLNFKSWKRSSEVLSYCLMSNKKQSATLS